MTAVEQALQTLGLNEKETAFYIYLLKNGAKTGSQIAKDLNENRTNAYMVLNKLLEDGLIEVDENKAVRQFQAADPEKLKGLVVAKQQQVRQAQASLNGVLPELASLFNLGQHKPGVIYFEGAEGYRSFQDDIARSDVPICVMASNMVSENEEALEILREAEDKRNARGNTCRMVFHAPAKDFIDLKMFKGKGYEIRFWGEQPLEGEIAIYGNKVGITAYQPALITTVITNSIIADTFRIIFDQIWGSAEPATSHKL